MAGMAYARGQKSCTFALLFGTRGFFAESLVAGARRDLQEAVSGAGHEALLLADDALPHGAVESTRDGEDFARFLREHRGRYDGVIVSLANFGDETGVVAALAEAGVPILVQAYPDELDQLAMNTRRDAFCGKFSVMDVLYQYGLPYTVFPPHVVHPRHERFQRQLQDFAGVCRVVRRMRKLVVGAIGARTTAFKTVRFDELALQKLGITTETLDLSEVISRVRGLELSDSACKEKAARLRAYTDWGDCPAAAFDNLCRLGVVLDEIVAQHDLGALALRCWLELERELGVSPCVLLSEINDRGLPAACELDVCNAVTMAALGAASGEPAACLDWNNNYGEEEEKCILFHCGPVAQSLMQDKGVIADHPMFAKVLGPGRGWGCNTGRIRPTPFTFASSKTENGDMRFYMGEGEITTDTIAEDFFGCAGVARIDDLQEKLLRIGKSGYRHHVSVTPGRVASVLREAFTTYLGYGVTALQ